MCGIIFASSRTASDLLKMKRNATIHVEDVYSTDGNPSETACDKGREWKSLRDKNHLKHARVRKVILCTTNFSDSLSCLGLDVIPVLCFGLLFNAVRSQESIACGVR